MEIDGVNRPEPARPGVDCRTCGKRHEPVPFVKIGPFENEAQAREYARIAQAGMIAVTEPTVLVDVVTEWE